MKYILTIAFLCLINSGKAQKGCPVLPKHFTEITGCCLSNGYITQIDTPYLVYSKYSKKYAVQVVCGKYVMLMGTDTFPQWNCENRKCVDGAFYDSCQAKRLLMAYIDRMKQEVQDDIRLKRERVIKDSLEKLRHTYIRVKQKP